MELWALVRRCLLPGLFVLSLLAARSAEAVTIEQFPLGATPTGLVTGPDEHLYVTTSAPSILRVTPEGAIVARYPLPSTGAPRPSLPTFAGQALWFVMTRTNETTGATTTSIGRRAANGSITEFPLPTPAAKITSLAAGPDGNVWFTESEAKDAVGRITPGGLVTEFGGASGTPTSVAADMTGQLWITQRNAKIAQLSTAGTLAETPVVSSPWKVVASPASSTLWFAARSSLCCYGQPWMDLTLWIDPGATAAQIGGGFLASSYLEDLTVGADGNAWATDNVAGGRIGRVSTSGRTTTFTAGLDGGTLRAIAAGPRDTVWFTNADGRIGRIRLDRPMVTTEEASAVGQTGANVRGTATPLGAVSKLRFEYGRAPEDRTATRWQPVGDGDTAVSRGARLEGLEPGTTYHYRAVVSSPFGSTYGPERTLTTEALPPPPPVPPADVDGDGYAAAIDCDDGNAAIFPGAPDTPGDGIDQDCSGADEPFPRFFPRVVTYFESFKQGSRRWSEFTELEVEDVPAGALVRLQCKGTGCRFKTSSMTVRKQTSRLDLLKRLKRSKVGRKAVLELRLTLPGHIGTVVRWTVGPPPKPVVTCLTPGAKKDVKC